MSVGSVFPPTCLTRRRHECSSNLSMATLAPDSYSYSDSDSDSSYGYDLTAEDEEAVAKLVAHASAHPNAHPVPAPSTPSPASSSTASLLRSDINVAFAVGTSLKTPSRRCQDLNTSRHNHGVVTSHNDRGVSSPPAKREQKLAPSSVSGDESLAAFVDRAQPQSIPDPAKVDNISYPDCRSRKPPQ